MKTIAQKIRELLGVGHPVQSKVIGCWGDIQKVGDNGLIYLKGTPNRPGGVFSMNHPLNHPEFALKKIKLNTKKIHHWEPDSYQWVLGNRLSWLRRAARKSKSILAGAFRNGGI